MKTVVDRDVYIRYEYQDTKEYIDDTSIVDTADIPREFTNIDGLSDDVKKTIKNVFQKFGAYDAVDLGQCINTIILYEGVTLEDNEVSLSKIYELTKDDFISAYSGKPVDFTLINYLFDSNDKSGDVNNE